MNPFRIQQTIKRLFKNPSHSFFWGPNFGKIRHPLGLRYVTSNLTHLDTSNPNPNPNEANGHHLMQKNVTKSFKGNPSYGYYKLTKPKEHQKTRGLTSTSKEKDLSIITISIFFQMILPIQKSDV